MSKGGECEKWRGRTEEPLGCGGSRETVVPRAGGENVRDVDPGNGLPKKHQKP